MVLIALGTEVRFMLESLLFDTAIVLLDIIMARKCQIFKIIVIEIKTKY